MTNNIGKPPESWRNFSTKVPIHAFRMKQGDLRRLYQIVDTKQIEVRDKVLGSLSRTPSESEEDFSARKERVHNAFVTSVTVTGLDDEMFHGNSESFFDSSSFPDRLRSILISTQTVPRAVLSFIPPCNIIVFLDFSRPPLIDFSRMPTLPTPNESNFEISADDELWFAASKARLSQFFDDRRTSTNWLHRTSIYDILLVFAGFPLAIWLSHRLGSLFDHIKAAPIVNSAVYVYTFFVGLIFFRILFEYSRWVFPKVELETELSSPVRHRGLWGAILLALLASLLYDGLKGLFF